MSIYSRRLFNINSDTGNPPYVPRKDPVASQQPETTPDTHPDSEPVGNSEPKQKVRDEHD